eukprot:3093870-Amphidinium_carterae.2
MEEVPPPMAFTRIVLHFCQGKGVQAARFARELERNPREDSENASLLQAVPSQVPMVYVPGQAASSNAVLVDSVHTRAEQTMVVHVLASDDDDPDSAFVSKNKRTKWDASTLRDHIQIQQTQFRKQHVGTHCGCFSAMLGRSKFFKSHWSCTGEVLQHTNRHFQRTASLQSNATLVHTAAGHGHLSLIHISEPTRPRLI